MASRSSQEGAARNAFKVQCVDGVRLTRNREGVLLHNVKTGEVVAVEEAKAWAWISLELDAEQQGVVLVHPEGDASASVSVWEWLVLRIEGFDMVHTKRQERWSLADLQKQIIPLAISLTRGQSVFRCELQVQKAPLAKCTFFWHVRWVVDWMGGHASSNFIGQGARSWANKVAGYLVCLPHDVDIEELSKNHFIASGQSKLRQSPRGTGDEENELERGMTEYAASTFALLVMALHWAARGPHKRSQWKLPQEQVRSQATSFMKVLTGTFVLTNLIMTIEGVTVVLLGEGADGVQLDWSSLCQADGFEILERVFKDCDGPLISLVDAMMLLCAEEVNTRVSGARRSASTQAIAILIEAVVSVLESSKLDQVWGETELWQLQALRTAS